VLGIVAGAELAMLEHVAAGEVCHG
jgi:hypothetical protein